MGEDNNFKEFGDLPEGWKWVKLGGFLKFLKGKTPSKSYDYKEAGTTIYLTPEYLRKNNCKIAFCKEKETLLVNEDIIILCDGSNAGEVFWAEKGAVASTMAKIEIDSSDYPIYKKFLYFYLKNNELTFKYHVKGSGIPHFEKDILETLNNIFPLFPEQQKIAEILETIDNAIEKTDKIIEKYKRIKQGLMQDLLTKGIDENGNIRSEQTHKFKDSPLSRIPEEWEVVSIYESVNIINGGTPSTSVPKYWNGNIPWLSVEDYNTGKRWVFSSSKYITELGLKKSTTKLLRKGMLIISARGTVGVLAQLGQDMAFNQTSYGLDSKFKNLLSNDFLYYALRYYTNLFFSLVYGNVFNTITRDTFRHMFLPLPPLPEQQRIAEILSQIDQTIEKEEQYKEKLQRIKQGLMRDLLTGKVRVNHLINEGQNNEA